MATLRDIKRRIVGVKSTQKITRAMKMVATARLRRAQQRIFNARPYADKIQDMLTDLATEEDILANKFFEEREVINAALVVVTADRGLCGAFNQNIIKEAQRYIEEELAPENINIKIFAVGKKGRDFFKRTNHNPDSEAVGIFSSLDYSSALKISDELVNGFLTKKYDKVVVVYNEFVSIIQQKIINKQILPIPLAKDKNENSLQHTNYIYEPDQKSILEFIIPKHIKAQIWRMLLESNAAELGARMTAMDNATTNAEELIKSLNLTYNKERQAAITKEILEIVSGANALKAGS